MNNYVCRIGTLEDINNDFDYEIANAKDDKDNWIKWKEEAIKRFNNGTAITYVGELNGEVISQAVATLDPNAVNNSENLVDDKTAYLQAFRTKEEYQGKGYFSILFKYMIEDLKKKGYERVTLGVEVQEEKNKAIYTKYGFTDYIKTMPDIYPDGTTIDVEYYGKSIK
ncbi:MAG: GNAT family N-acetyltransferase [Bacilli bacterium]|nr:GNAT family N-acetyltransferase [Bacilli bacterium]